MYSDCFLFHRQYIYHRHKLILSKEKPPMNYDIIITYIAKMSLSVIALDAKFQILP